MTGYPQGKHSKYSYQLDLNPFHISRNRVTVFVNISVVDKVLEQKADQFLVVHNIAIVFYIS